MAVAVEIPLTVTGMVELVSELGRAIDAHGAYAAAPVDGLQEHRVVQGLGVLERARRYAREAAGRDGTVHTKSSVMVGLGETREELRQAFREAAKTPRLKGILQAVDEPLVSIDYKGDPHSSSVDLPFTQVLGKDKGDFIKVVAWYDNEWGYSVRTADLAAMLAKSL